VSSIVDGCKIVLMPIASPRYAFTKAMLAGAPPDPGVYALWIDNELVYYGRANAIQSALLEHLNSGRPCTVRATHYAWEIALSPSLREAELLREFESVNRRLPRCNTK